MKIIGLISGTSGDGIDAALCEITGAPPDITIELIHGLTLPYPDELRQRILKSCDPASSQVDAICQLNFDLGEAFASAIAQLLELANFSAGDVDLIASHGQTIWHQIDAQGNATSTLQIVEASVIAERTAITTISNFRARDLAVGGQGAPFAAYFDWLMMRHPDHWRAVQNLGGIGNVTFLPPLNDNGSAPLAFDTGPGNVLMDAAIYKLSGGTQTFDENGDMARRGQIDEAWLERLLRHPYYEALPPKTTGRELFSTAMAHELVAEGKGLGLDDASIMATLAALTAHSIADAYRRFAPQPVKEVILAGGGVHNPFLVELIQKAVGEVPVLAHDAVGINSDYKEAVMFALLAHETWHNRTGNLPALTGADRTAVLGQITPGANYARLIRETWR